MAIYDSIIFTQTATGMQLLPAGKLGLYYFTIASQQAIMFRYLQVAQTEDFSIRGWFSLTPGGISIISGRNAFFNLPRIPITSIVHDKSRQVDIPVTTTAIPVKPGNYILNFLNLANAENILSMQIGSI